MENSLHNKTRDHILYVCANLECRVSTFIREMICPSCEQPGDVLRQPYDGRGAPNLPPQVIDE